MSVNTLSAAERKGTNDRDEARRERLSSKSGTGQLLVANRGEGILQEVRGPV